MAPSENEFDTPALGEQPRLTSPKPTSPPIVISQRRVPPTIQFPRNLLIASFNYETIIVSNIPFIPLSSALGQILMDSPQDYCNGLLPDPSAFFHTPRPSHFTLFTLIKIIYTPLSPLDHKLPQGRGGAFFKACTPSSKYSLDNAHLPNQ